MQRAQTGHSSIIILLGNLISMAYLQLSDSSSDSESDHEEIQDSSDVQDFPELSLVDDLRTSLHITDRDGWCIVLSFMLMDGILF